MGLEPPIATSEVGKPQGGTEAKVKGTPALFKKIFQDLTSAVGTNCKCVGYYPLRIHGTGIFTYIWLIFMVNVGKYSIHGFYGVIIM